MLSMRSTAEQADSADAASRKEANFFNMANP
jgi:hypothetical protein